MLRQRKSYIYAILAVFFWATAASAFKISLRYIHYLHLLFFSSLFSLLSLLVILIFQRKLYLIRSCSIKHYLYSAGLGFLNPFLYYLVLFKAYSLLPAQQAMTLNYIWPIMLVLLSIPLLKQRIGLISIIAIFVGFIDVLIISTEGNISTLKFTNTTGVALALCSSVIWALFWILNLKDKRDVAVKLFLNFLSGFIFIAVVTLTYGKLIINSIQVIIGPLYIGLFEMSITFILWLTALQLSKTTAQVSNLIYLAPFLSLVGIYLILGEKILIPTFLGLILIISGILLQRLEDRRKRSFTSS